MNKKASLQNVSNSRFNLYMNRDLERQQKRRAAKKHREYQNKKKPPVQVVLQTT